MVAPTKRVGVKIPPMAPDAVLDTVATSLATSTVAIQFPVMDSSDRVTSTVQLWIAALTAGILSAVAMTLFHAASETIESMK